MKDEVVLKKNVCQLCQSNYKYIMNFVDEKWWEQKKVYCFPSTNKGSNFVPLMSTKKIPKKCPYKKEHSNVL